MQLADRPRVRSVPTDKALGSGEVPESCTCALARVKKSSYTQRHILSI